MWTFISLVDFGSCTMLCLSLFFFIKSFYSYYRSSQSCFFWQMLLRTDVFLFPYSWIESNVFFCIARISAVGLFLIYYSENKVVASSVTFFKQKLKSFWCTCMWYINFHFPPSVGIHACKQCNKNNANKQRQREKFGHRCFSLARKERLNQRGVETCRVLISGIDKDLSCSPIKC